MLFRSKSSAVFSGKVIEINKNSSSHTKTVKFDVERTWKGVSEKQVTVITGSDDGNCGYPFMMNETYLVYSYGEDSLYTSSCGRNTLFENAYDDLRTLGNGTTVPEFSISAVSILGAGLLLLLLFHKRKWNNRQFINNP